MTTQQTARPRGMEVLRTPDERFDDLVDYPFEPHYVEIDAGTRLRVHYVDERPPDPATASGETILLLHGNPSWSYLYRHVIPPLVAAGHRCVAPDLVGFGRSDKPADRFAYTYQNHVDWLRETVVDPAVRAGYNAPFPDETYLQGARQFPLLIPLTPHDEAAPANRNAWAVLETLHTPFLCAFSDKDWGVGDGNRVLRERIPGAAGQAHTSIADAGHFVQEDQGAELAAVVADFIRSTR
jgi:pimeloyl-ACP methyl ester carboxylesterase